MSVRVVLKHEGETEAGEAFGPVTVIVPGQQSSPRPFDPNRPLPRWYTATEAAAIAAEHGVELEIT